MNCNEIKEQFPDFLTGELDIESAAAVKNHLAGCAVCRGELDNLNEIWTKLGVLPEEQPGESLRSNFYTMLESYKAGLEREEKRAVDLIKKPARFFGKLFDTLWPRQPVYQFAFILILLLVGFSGGLFLRGPDRGEMERAQLRREVRELRRSAALSMLKQDSASARLRGVNFSAHMESPDRTLLAALLDTLDSDPDVNVRLSAVDALYLFSNDPMVKEGLISSLSRQDSPLVQAALIDLIVEIREKRAAQALRDLLARSKLDPRVKKQAQLSLQNLTL